MCKIGILDYGLGNIGSIKNMLKYVSHCDIQFVSNPDDIISLDKLILPGVGAFDAGMNLLTKNGFIETIKDFAEAKKKPILGICLGMQLLGNRSEEGELEGLGLIDFDVIRFQSNDLKIPHMGWDYVKIRRDAPLIKNIPLEEERYYFVHSYHAVCAKEENVLMTTHYGYEFASAVFKGNIYGVQFHPEKSHSYGMKILKNFVEEC